jgi:hypothetical protein
MFTTERQKKIASALVPLLQWSTFANTMTSTQLLAESLVVPLSDSLPLAPDQWILETKNMYRIGLATVQRLMVDFITGPSAPYSNYVPKNQADNDTELDWLCRNQIIRCNDYLNFSSLSLWFIVGFALVVIVVSLWIETFVGWLREKGGLEMKA